MTQTLKELLARFVRTSRSIFAGRPALTFAFVGALALGFWAAGGWFVWTTVDAARDLPEREAIAGISDMVQATTLYDAHDKPAFTIFTEQRIDVPLANISPHLIKAVLAIEDQRFYEHKGVDLIRIIAAGLANLREGRAAQGGSTITQQLARQSLLTRDKTIRRKIRELMLATQIESAYTKNKILEMYLNKVYFGDGLYGAEAASLGYFGKHASELTLIEAALLAGLVKSPSAYAPTHNLPAATSRRNVVLQALNDARVIDRPALQRLRGQPVILRDALRREEGFGLYFKEHVRRELVDRFGWDRVYEGGLRVYTTIAPALQKAAESLTEEALRGIEERKGYPHRTRAQLAERQGGMGEQARSPYLQAALVAIDPATGHIRAMIGGRNFDESHFNRATQAKRQPGSAFKPFVYAAALEAGFTPASVIDNLDDPIWTPQGNWVPEDEHLESSSMTLRTALRTSSNRAAVQLLQLVGISKTVKYATKLQVGTVPSVPSLALGSGEVTLQSMTRAYAAFADGGRVRPSVLIRRVEDRDGKVLYQAKDEPVQAIQESTAFLMANMLADVVNAGTAYRARSEGFTLPAAGKTGTTNDYVDAWFVGFTPRLVTGVWVGFDRPQTIVRNGYGGELAVPLWAHFMKKATAGDKPDWFERPRNISGMDICRLSGQLPATNCYNVETVSKTGEVKWRSYVATEYFVRGTEPDTQCQLHRSAPHVDPVAVAVRNPEPPPPPPAQPMDNHGTVASSPAATSGGVLSDEERKREEEKLNAGKKKRGFWSRLFGRGRDKEKDKKKEDEKDPDRE